MTEDSYAGDPNDPQELNRYIYVKGNPLRYTDPTGHRIHEDEEDDDSSSDDNSTSLSGESGGSEGQSSGSGNITSRGSSEEPESGSNDGSVRTNVLASVKKSLRSHVWTISNEEFIDENALSLNAIKLIMQTKNPKLVEAGLPELLFEAAHKEHINPKVLLATLAQEQSWGKVSMEKLFGIGEGGNPRKMPIAVSVFQAAALYRNAFDEAMKRGVKPIRIDYDPEDKEQIGVLGSKLKTWQEAHPAETEKMHEGELITPVNAAMYAKLKYTPWTNFPPQGSEPLWDWQYIYKALPKEYRI